MLDPWGERRDGTRDEGGRGCEIHTCEAELRAISPAAKLSLPRNSCVEPFLPAKRLRQIFLSRRETGWRTLIWVLSGVRRKIGHLFAYSVGGRFFYPKYCASRIYGFGSPFAYFVGDSLRLTKWGSLSKFLLHLAPLPPTTSGQRLAWRAGGKPGRLLEPTSRTTVGRRRTGGAQRAGLLRHHSPTGLARHTCGIAAAARPLVRCRTAGSTSPLIKSSETCLTLPLALAASCPSHK